MTRLLFLLFLILNLAACDANTKQSTSASTNQESYQMQNDQENYTQKVTNPPGLDPNRKEFKCAAWNEPVAPDAASERWYKAATTIHAKRFRLNEADYQKMLILYEGAARKGHYKAIKNLIVLYNEGGHAMATEFPPEPQKARYWLHYGLNKGWAGAFEWLSNALHYGNAGYAANENLSGAYLQKAADLGVPFAQYELAQIYGDKYDRRDAKLILLNCASTQNFSPALNLLAINKEIDGQEVEAIKLYQRSIMEGGVRGSASAMVLTHAFTQGELAQEELKTTTDLERAKAYKEIEVALDGTETTSGNIFLKFPRLNEVLPLPPAKMPPWQGIYSAMSKEDAKYYQNLPNPDDLIKEITEAGFLVPKDYLVNPIPFENNPRYKTESSDTE